MLGSKVWWSFAWCWTVSQQEQIRSFRSPGFQCSTCSLHSRKMEQCKSGEPVWTPIQINHICVPAFWNLQVLIEDLALWPYRWCMFWSTMVTNRFRALSSFYLIIYLFLLLNELSKEILYTSSSQNESTKNLQFNFMYLIGIYLCRSREPFLARIFSVWGL
jgi:hypothetical protein